MATIIKTLRKYSRSVYRNKSGSDTSQVPASATLTVYRQGATVTTGTTVANGGTNHSITVRDAGRIEVGDVLIRASDLVAGNSTPTVTVDQVNSRTSIRVDSDSNGAMALVEDDRLVPTNAKPTLYDERSGVSTLASLATSATTGLAECYIAERFSDILVTGSGLTSVFLEDEHSGHAGEELIATEFPTLQDAIDATPAGGSLYIPSGNYDAPSGGLVLTRKITIRGDGVGNDIAAQNGTTIHPASANDHTFTCVTDGADHIAIRNLRIQGTGTAGSGIGINLVASAARISAVTIENVFISGMGLHGVFTDEVDFLHMERVYAIQNKGDGFRLTDGAQFRAFHCYSLLNDDLGMYVNEIIGFQLDGIGIQANQQDQTAKADDTSPQMWVNTSHAVSIQRIAFEEFDNTTTHTALVLDNCRGVIIAGNDFSNSAAGSSRALYIADNNQGIFVAANRMREVSLAIEIATAAEAATTVSSNIFIAEQGYQDTVTTKFDIPNATDRAGKNIVIASADFGFLPPVFTDAGEPAGGSAMWEGAIWYRRDGTNGWFGDDGTGQVQLG